MPKCAYLTIRYASSAKGLYFSGYFFPNRFYIQLFAFRTFDFVVLSTSLCCPVNKTLLSVQQQFILRIAR